jgi:hypothetical protein
MDIGTKFTKTIQGYTVTGFGMLSKGYQVIEQIGSMYACQLLVDDSVPKVNPDYREFFTEEQIKILLTSS